MRSISGASTKNQLHMQAMKGYSSTPKNAIGSHYRGNSNGLQLVNNGVQGTRYSNQKNMTQVLNMREHLPVDFNRVGTSHVSSSHHGSLNQ